jgi:hypothetical protein
VLQSYSLGIMYCDSLYSLILRYVTSADTCYFYFSWSAKEESLTLHCSLFVYVLNGVLMKWSLMKLGRKARLPLWGQNCQFCQYGESAKY